MKKQLYWEDVEVGTEIPPLMKHPSTQTLVKWAGGVHDYAQIHYDKDFALSRGLPGVIVHGALRNAYLGQLVWDWMGEQGTLIKLSCQQRGIDVPGDTLICKGKVTKKYLKNDDHYIECEIWVENSMGEKTAPGAATVILPSKES